MRVFFTLGGHVRGSLRMNVRCTFENVCNTFKNVRKKFTFFFFSFFRKCGNGDIFNWFSVQIESISNDFCNWLFVRIELISKMFKLSKTIYLKVESAQYRYYILKAVSRVHMEKCWGTISKEKRIFMRCLPICNI